MRTALIVLSQASHASLIAISSTSATLASGCARCPLRGCAMAGSHSRLVAVQTVVVGVLMIVVFVTLLQPESDMPLSSVEGPAAGPGRTELPSPDIYTGAENEPNDKPNPPGPGDRLEEPVPPA